jgi:hypothetical protein
MIGDQSGKVSWSGTIVGVQPRIRLMRSFDQSSHTYQGYVLRLAGEIAGEQRSFIVALGKGAHEKHGFRVRDVVSGVGEPVAVRETEIADLYKVSQVVVEQRGSTEPSSPPPWCDPAPSLDAYRARGHRRLDAERFASACTRCMWCCEMAVEIVIDQWNPGKVRWRRESFCYGPKSCALYKPGPKRKVPGRKGMSWTEDDWIDEEATSHRGPNE